MKNVTLYEPASSDGYVPYGAGFYFLDEGLAKQWAINKHGAYAVDPIIHNAVEREDGRFLILKSTEAVSVMNTAQLKEDIRLKALSKLSPEEREVLGL